MCVLLPAMLRMLGCCLPASSNRLVGPAVTAASNTHRGPLHNKPTPCCTIHPHLVKGMVHQVDPNIYQGRRAGHQGVLDQLPLRQLGLGHDCCRAAAPLCPADWDGCCCNTEAGLDRQSGGLLEHAEPII